MQGRDEFSCRLEAFQYPSQISVTMEEAYIHAKAVKLSTLFKLITY